ncbi:hypothetical protein K1719_008074 [Acacia pycnantha]|nr:hypothetical protein K1719_008074 [Acacia pycnantha]
MFQFSTVVAAFAALIFFLCYCHRRRQCYKDPLFTEWPVLGMTPPLVYNLWRCHDHITEALQRQAGTGNFIGPRFTRMDSIMTCDPMNAHHIMSKNFANYGKGPAFRKIFDLFGDTLFTSDSDAWKRQRTFLHSLFVKTKRFEKLQEKIILKKVETCLVPVIDHVERQGSDPKNLAIDFPEIECETAFNKAEEFIFYRHIVPKRIEKLQRWLGIGLHKKIDEPFEDYDRFLRETIASRRAEISQKIETMK